MSDIKPGDLVTFEGDMYRVTAFGDRRGTFDIVRHPNDMLGDRWRNVPPNELRPVLKQSSGKSSADGYLNTNAHLEAKVAMLTAQLAESQAREAQLREAILQVCCDPEGEPCFVGSTGDHDVIRKVLALPTDDTALKTRLKAERERCAKAFSQWDRDGRWAAGVIRNLGDE